MINGNNSQKRDVIPSVIVAVFVVALCVAGALLNNTDQTIPERLKNGFPLYFFGAFAIAGLATMISAVSTIRYRKIYCTYVTDAVCVDLVHRLSTDSDGHSSSVYAPVYEFEYNGRPQTIRNNHYTSRNIAPAIGSRVTLHIDIEEFSDYYIGRPSNGLVGSIVVGLVFSIPALAILIGVLLQGLGML